MSFLERQLEDPARLKRLKRLALLALVLILAADVLRSLLSSGHHDSEHGPSKHLWFEELPAFGSVYGLLSCVLIILVSKLIGKVWLMRPEDHYDD